MKDIVERLRARVIIVAKPGTKPFKPDGPIEMTFGGGPFKAGDDAGIQSVAASYNFPSSQWWVQEHIYAVEPLCAEAADEIERLRANGPYLTIQEGECPELDAVVNALTQSDAGEHHG